MGVRVPLRSRHFLSENLWHFDTFRRTSVRVSKMNAVARAQLIFQMLTYNIYIYIYIYMHAWPALKVLCVRYRILDEMCTTGELLWFDLVWHQPIAWWRHEMKTFSTLLAICEETTSSNTELWCSLWPNFWANNRDAGDLRRHPAHYDGTVMAVLPISFRVTSLEMTVVQVAAGVKQL